jgi:hypothetical protein
VPTRNKNQESREEKIMKTIASALVALSLFVAVAAPASAFDPRTYFQELERNLP